MSRSLLRAARGFARSVLAGIVYGVLVIGVAYGGASLLQAFLIPAADSAAVHLVQQPVDEVKSGDTIAPSRASTSGGSSHGFRIANDAGFDHARPAPTVFTRATAEDIEAMSASDEHLVGADASAWHRGEAETFRTVCVRLCDGAYFQISYSTTRDRFAADEAVCRSRCGAPARLFVHRNPGGAPETMTDLSGRSYLAMPTAFTFRKHRVAGCACRAEAWQEASRHRHRLYALQEARDTGRSFDAAELRRLEAAVTVAETHIAKMAPHAASSPVASSRPPQVAAFEQRTPSEQAPQASAPLPARAVLAAFEPEAKAQAPVVPPLPVLHSPNVVETSSIAPAATRATSSSPAAAEADVQSRRRNPRLHGRATARTLKRAPQPGPRAPVTRATDKAEGLPIWGVGRNAATSPRGPSAREVFARNFY